MMEVCVAGFPYLAWSVGFVVVVALVELVLDVRQYGALGLERPPEALRGVVSEGAFRKARAYSLAKARAAFVRDPLLLVQGLVFLAVGVQPRLWAWAGVRADAWGLGSAGDGTTRGEAAQASLFVLALAGVDTVVGLLPSLHATFVVEARHGFNKTTPREFVLDLVKSQALALVLVPPAVLGGVAVARAAGDRLVPALWAFLLGLQLFGMAVFPTLIAPLFNRYDPLPDGPLRTKIEGLARRVGFPLRQLYVVDGSRRSAHSNAYMYGFGRHKRIVLYDTLLAQAGSDEDVVGVLAHELGHWKLGHTLRIFLASQAILVAQLALFTLVRGCGPLYASFGFAGRAFGDAQAGDGTFPLVVGLALFGYLVAPLDHVLSLAQNGVSRRFEFEADAFGFSLGYRDNLKAALVKLQEENASAMNVDPLYSWYHHSHPTLPERLAALDALSFVDVVGSDAGKRGKAD